MELRASDPERYGTQMKLAAATGLDQKSWSNYLSGECKPSRLARATIQQTLGIDPALWDQPYKRRRHRNDPTDGAGESQAPSLSISSEGEEIATASDAEALA